MLSVLLALTGCVAAPDTDTVSERIVTQAGISGADVEIQHPGAPWNTEAVVWVYVDDTSVGAVAAVVRDAAAAIEADGSMSGTPVAVFAVDGSPGDFGSRSERNAAVLQTMKDVSLEVGVRPGAPEMLQLAADDVTRLAAQ